MNFVAVIEWTWTIQSLVGILVCCWALVDSYADRAALQWAVLYARARGLPVPNHGGEVVVRMNIRGGRAGLVLHVFFGLLGLGALLTQDQEFSSTFLFIGLSYIIVAFINLRAVLLNQIDRVGVRREELKGSTITGSPSEPPLRENEMLPILKETPPAPEPDPKPDDEGDGTGGGTSEG